MSHVVVVTKPHHTNIILPVIRRMHPGRRIVGVLDGSVSLLNFRYPRGLSMADYPFVSDPVWHPCPKRTAWGGRTYEMVDGERRTLDMDPFVAVRDAEAVICAEGDWYGGAANFDMLTRYSGGDALADAPHAVLPWLRPRQVERPIEELGIGSTNDPTFTALRDGGLAKRRFDWCFAVNSQAILGAAWRQATGLRDGPMIGKYALQLLYALRDGKIRTDSSILGLMHTWRGTGRYQPRDKSWQMGSAMSVAAILQDMKDGMLVEERSLEGRTTPHFSISAAGLRLLDLLHPDCRDPDLPFRIRQWQEQGRDSHAAIDRYVRTFFGKQKRHSRR